MNLIGKIIAYKLFRNFNWPKVLPMNITIGLTYRCNSRCKTCNVWKMKSKNELTLEELDKIFKNLSTAANWLILSGGEPFLRNDIAGICKSAYKHCKPKIIVIPTNGLLYQIIPKRVEEILKSCPRTHLTINLSLDSIGKKHDKIRGVKGNFDKLLKTYWELGKLKPKYKNLELGIHTVISKFNYKNIPEIYNFVKEKLRPDSFITEIAEERVELGTRGEKITPSYSNYSGAIDALSLQIKKKKPLSLKQLFRLEYYQLVKRMLKEKRQIIPCYAGIASAQISPDGEVWMCCVRAESIGNLRDNRYDFKKIWFSKKADKQRNSIKRGECYCPLASASYNNMLMVFPILGRVLFNYFKIK